MAMPHNKKKIVIFSVSLFYSIVSAILRLRQRILNRQFRFYTASLAIRLAKPMPHRGGKMPKKPLRGFLKIFFQPFVFLSPGPRPSPANREFLPFHSNSARFIISFHFHFLLKIILDPHIMVAHKKWSRIPASVVGLICPISVQKPLGTTYLYTQTKKSKISPTIKIFGSSVF